MNQIWDTNLDDLLQSFVLPGNGWLAFQQDLQTRHIVTAAQKITRNH